jgi:hypothetical protein
MNLDLKDSFGDITLKDIVGNVKVESFQGDFTAGTIDGEIDLSIKYGDAEIGNFKSGEATLFRSKSNFGSTKKMELNAKYSDVDIIGVSELELVAFQTNVKIEKEAKKISGKVKYGDLIIDNNVNIIELDIFQAKVDVYNVIDFEVKGSYSNIKAKNVDNLYAINAFQSDYRIGTVGTLKGDSKYTSFDIGVLSTELDLKTFQGSVDIDEVLAKFQKLDINSKYTPIFLTFSADSKFKINAETTYTDFDYPDNLMQVEEEIKENQKMTFKGVFNANNNKEPSMVSVVSFQGKLNLK